MKKGLRLARAVAPAGLMDSENSPDEEGIKTHFHQAAKQLFFIRRTALMKKGLRPTLCTVPSSSVHIRRTALMKKGLRPRPAATGSARHHSENSPDEEGIKTGIAVGRGGIQ